MSEERRDLTANFTGNASGFARAANKTVQHLRELNKEMAQVKNSIKETNAQIREHEKKLERMRRETNNGANATEQQRREMQQLEDAISQCNADLGTYRTTQQRLQSEIRSTNRQLDEQRDSAQTVSQAFSSMGDVLRANLLSGAIMNGLQELLYLLKSAAGYAYNVGSSFEAAMSQVGAISGAAGSELAALTEKAKEMGASTKFTASQAAEALNYMAMAGWKTEDMLSGIDGVINLAAASGEDLGTTSDIVTDALTAFGLSAKDSAHFADVLAAASSNSNTNVAMMGETFKYCAPIAGALGYSIEDTAVAIGIMANSGIKASQAGTALRTIMTNLSSDVKIAGENIGEVTIATTNADGSMREFADIIADLRTAFAGLTESEKTATAESLAGKYAMSGFLALMNSGEQDVAKLTAAIENCEGATSSMADAMQNNLKGSVTIAQSALEGFGISLYEKFSGGLKEAVEIITEGIGELDRSVQGGVLDNSIDRLSDSFVELANEVVRLGTEAIPDFIGGIADVISFVVEFRDEIGAVVEAFVTFKGAMAVGNIIKGFKENLSGLIANFRNVREATENATAAQNANNAAAAANPYLLVATALATLAGAYSLVMASMDDCTERMREMQQESDELTASAEEYAATADDLQTIADKYEEITKSEKNAVDKKIELRDIQQDLIDQYGQQAAGIDLVNGKYDEQIAKLDELIGKYDGFAQADAKQALNFAQNAEKETLAVRVGWYSNPFDDQSYSDTADALNALWTLDLPTFKTRNVNHLDEYLYFEGSYADRARDLKAYYDYLVETGMENSDLARTILSYANEMNTAAIDLESKQAWHDSLTGTASASAPVYDPTAHYRDTDLAYKAEAEALKARTEAQKAAEAEAAALDEEQRMEQYKAEKQLADDMYSVREIGDKEYYAELERLRDTYLKRNSHEWYTATSELIRLAESIGDAAEKTADRIADSLDGIKQTYQELMAAIDAELEKREREKQDEELQSKIDAVSARLAYENIDEYSRIALEKELSDLREQREDIDFERNITDGKAQIQAAYAASQELISLPSVNIDPYAWQDTVNAAFAQIAEGYMPSASAKDKKEAAVIYNTITINAESKTPAQIYAEIEPYLGGGL